MLKALQNSSLEDLQEKCHYGNKFKSERIPEDVIRSLVVAAVTVKRLVNAPKKFIRAPESSVALKGTLAE